MERDAEAARAGRAEAAVASLERRHRRELRAGSRELEEAHRALQELSQRCRKLEAEAVRLRGRQHETRRCCYIPGGHVHPVLTSVGHFRIGA